MYSSCNSGTQCADDDHNEKWYIMRNEMLIVTLTATAATTISDIMALSAL